MSNFISAWETLFGTYAPIEVMDQVTGEITCMTDWGYVARCAFFIIIVFCVLKLIGGVLKNDKR